MAALVAVVVVAAAWRPVRHGAVLLAGAIIPMAAQAISAGIQIGEATSPLQFGITPGQAARAGLTISSGLTPAFWIYCVFIVALMLTCALMLSTPRAAARRPRPARSRSMPPRQLPRRLPSRRSAARQRLADSSWHTAAGHTAATGQSAGGQSPEPVGRRLDHTVNPAIAPIIALAAPPNRNHSPAARRRDDDAAAPCAAGPARRPR